METKTSVQHENHVSNIHFPPSTFPLRHLIYLNQRYAGRAADTADLGGIVAGRGSVTTIAASADARGRKAPTLLITAVVAGCTPAGTVDGPVVGLVLHPEFEAITFAGTMLSKSTS